MIKKIFTILLFCSIVQASSIIGGNLYGQTIPGNSSKFACILGVSQLSDNESEREILLSESTSFNTLSAKIIGYQPSDNYLFVIVRKNGQDTNLMFYIDPSDGNYTTTVGLSIPVSFSSGDRVSLKIENYSNSNSAGIGAFSIK